MKSAVQLGWWSFTSAAAMDTVVVTDLVYNHGTEHVVVESPEHVCDAPLRNWEISTSSTE